MRLDIFSNEALFCMPQILQKALDASYQVPSDFAQLIYWLELDPVLSTHVTNAYFHHLQSESVSETTAQLQNSSSLLEASLNAVGIEGIRTILVRLAVKQAHQQYSAEQWQTLKHFWCRSVYSARIARALALLTSGEGSSDYMYLITLIQNIGQLMNLLEHSQAYQSICLGGHDGEALLQVEQGQVERGQAEQGLPGGDHCELAARKMMDHQWPRLMINSVRFHHVPLSAIKDAEHMVKIANIAGVLSCQDSFKEDSPKLLEIEQLLGIKPALIIELRLQLAEELVAQSLEFGLPVVISDFSIQNDELGQKPESGQERETGNEKSQPNQEEMEQVLAVQYALAQSIAGFNQCQQLCGQILTVESRQQLDATLIISICELAGVRQGLLFEVDAANSLIKNKPVETLEPLFSISLESGRSIVVDSCLEKQIKNNSTELAAKNQLSVVDCQIMDYLEADTIFCLPLQLGQPHLAVAVLGVSAQQLKQLEQQKPDLEITSKLLTQCVPVVVERLQIASGINDSAQQLFEQQIRETLHEVNNPLAIVSNYLQTMRIKNAADSPLQEDIERISRELVRVGILLQGLSEKVTSAAKLHDVTEEINHVVKATAAIIDRGLLQKKNIRLSLDLGKGLEDCKFDRTVLQQILTNLLKNAAEALPDDGQIWLETKIALTGDQHQLLTIDVRDNGPGLPESVQANLFKAVVSQKVGHSGLGLQIVKKLVDSLGGSIFCRSSNAGTNFQIFLPR